MSVPVWSQDSKVTVSKFLVGVNILNHKKNGLKGH